MSPALWAAKILPSLTLWAVLICAGPALSWTWLQAPLEDSAPDEGSQFEAKGDYSQPGAAAGQCIAAILAAQSRYNIPDNLLLALGIQEAGWQSPHGLTVWPWSVSAAGEGRRFNSRREAEAFVNQKLAQGVSSIDVGCLQINLRWHPDAFHSASQGFDVTRNVDYAARFLHDLYLESGDWMTAAGRYHSRSPGPQSTYLAGLARNQRIVNAQFGQFRALASASDIPYSASDTYGDSYATAPPSYRTEGAIWGASIAGTEGARRTLYSNEDLQPVLPDFLPPPEA